MIGGELERATLGRFFVPLASPKVLAFDNKNKKTAIFILYCAHFFVPLASPKVLAFDNKNKKTSCFILYCAHFFVPLPLNRDEGL